MLFPSGFTRACAAGTSTTRDTQHFVSLGFDVVLPKPFDIQDMSRALATRRNTPAALPPIVEEKQDEAAVLMAVSAAAADA